MSASGRKRSRGKLDCLLWADSITRVTGSIYSQCSPRGHPAVTDIAITDKIQIPIYRDLTENDCRYYSLSLLQTQNDVPKVSAMTRVDCNKVAARTPTGVSNKLVTATVPLASWIHIVSFSGHSNQFAANKLTCHSCLLFQLLMLLQNILKFLHWQLPAFLLPLVHCILVHHFGAQNMTDITPQDEKQILLPMPWIFTLGWFTIASWENDILFNLPVDGVCFCLSRIFYIWIVQ